MRFFPYLLLAISTWLFCGNFLDDTFIHLRYARNLLATGTLAYNIGEPSFGCSAPLYVWLMMPVLAVFPEHLWPYVPKLLSISCHFATLAIILRISRARGFRYAPLWASGLLCTPLVTRWMQDGMETSLAVFLCILAVSCLVHSRPSNFTLGLFILAVSLIGGLRLDLLPHGFCLVAAGMILWRRKVLLVALAAMFVPHALMWYSFGSIIPDTAVAKHGGGFSFGWLMPAFISIAAMHPLWLAAIVLPILAAWSSIRGPEPDKWRAALLVLLWLPLAAVFLSGMMRNQILHGARYFMPSLCLAGFASLVLSASLSEVNRRFAKTISIAVLIASWGMCALLASKINVMRFGISNDIPEVVNDSKSVFGFDIGILGWETRARILDGSRLVNGREVAKMSSATWFQRLAADGWANYLVLDDGDLNFVLSKVAGATLSEKNSVLTLPVADREPFVFDLVQPVMRQQSVNRLLVWNLWRKR